MGQSSWSETSPHIAPRASLTERARRQTLRRVGADASDTVAAAALAFGVGWQCAPSGCRRLWRRPHRGRRPARDYSGAWGDEQTFLQATTRRCTQMATNFVDIDRARLLDVGLTAAVGGPLLGSFPAARVGRPDRGGDYRRVPRVRHRHRRRHPRCDPGDRPVPRHPLGPRQRCAPAECNKKPSAHRGRQRRSCPTPCSEAWCPAASSKGCCVGPAPAVSMCFATEITCRPCKVRIYVRAKAGTSSDLPSGVGAGLRPRTPGAHPIGVAGLGIRRRTRWSWARRASRESDHRRDAQRVCLVPVFAQSHGLPGWRTPPRHAVVTGMTTTLTRATPARFQLLEA